MAACLGHSHVTVRVAHNIGAASNVFCEQSALLFHDIICNIRDNYIGETSINCLLIYIAVSENVR